MAQAGGRKAGTLLSERLKDRFPDLFITMSSVLTGVVFADLVTEARGRMRLWPLDVPALIGWCQLLLVASSAVIVWVHLSHTGASRRRLPTLADTAVTIGPPVMLLVVDSFVGRAQLWPFLYAYAAFAAACIASIHLHVRLIVSEPDLKPMRRLLWPKGHIVILYLGIGPVLLAALADQRGLVPPWAELALMASLIPSAWLHGWLFFRDWRAAVAEIDQAG